MRRWKKWGILASAALMLGMSGSTCYAAKASDTLKVGVRDDIINFGYYNETTKKYYGLEIDIAEELADRLGYKEVEFEAVIPENRKEKLLNGEVDCLIAAYTISDTRKENFDFSAPYYTDTMVIMYQKSTLFSDIKDLKGKTMGVVNGADAGPLLAETLFKEGLITEEVIANTDEYTEYSDARVLKAGTYAELSEMLETGEVDAVCLDKCLAASYMNEDRTFLDYVVREQQFGVAAQKDSELAASINETIQEMLDDGTIDALIDKWD